MGILARCHENCVSTPPPISCDKPIVRRQPAITSTLQEMVWWDWRGSERLFWNYCVWGTLWSSSEIWHIPDNPRTLMWAASCSLFYHTHLPSLSLCRKKLLLVQGRLLQVINQDVSANPHAFRRPHLWYTLVCVYYHIFLEFYWSSSRQMRNKILLVYEASRSPVISYRDRRIRSRHWTCLLETLL